MNPRYLETFRRHRALFLLLIASAVATATWFNVGEPKLYRATVTLWSDMPGGSGQDPLGAPPPAAQEQQLLNELLTTRYFRDRIARRGPLAGYLGSHPVEGWGPKALLTKLRRTGTIDERIATALGPKRVTSAVQGPHVLEITFDAPAPALAVSTLRSLVEEFEHQRVVLRHDSLASYRSQVQKASAALVAARTRLQRYLRDHQADTRSPELAALARAQRAAVGRLADATEQLDAASVETSDPRALARSLRVIDPPERPLAPTTGRKRIVLGMFAGLFAGVLVSVLGVVALTMGGEFVRRTRESAREAAEAAETIRVSEEDGDGTIAEELAERRTRWARPV